MPYDTSKRLQRFSIQGKRYAMAWSTEQEGAAWEALARLAIAQGRPVPGKGDNVLPGQDVKRRVLGGRDVGTLQNVFRTTNKLVWEPQGEGSSKQALNAEIFVRWAGPNTAAAEAFKQERIDAFIEYLQVERRVSNTTVNKYMSAVRAMMQRAGMSKEDVPELPFYDTPQGRVRFFTDEEQDMIERQWRLWGKEREADFFVFNCKTGARPYIDAQRLHWTNVFAPKAGPAAVHFLAAKGGHARTVPLAPEAWDAVSRQDRTLPGPWAWTDKDTMIRLWRKTQATFPALQDAVFYCTRHTFGTDLYRKSRDIKLVKDMMGHKNITTTEIYVHVVGSDHSAIVAELMSRRAPLLAEAR